MSVKKFLIVIALAAIIIVGFVYPLPYYIMQPGGAYDLDQYVKVDNADQKGKGKLNMMTVSMAVATPFTYAAAYADDEKDILKEDEVRSPNESDKDYNNRQIKLMTDSQFNAKYIAFKKTGLDYKIVYNGVYVYYVVKNGAADGILETADEVTGIDRLKIHKHQQLVDYLTTKESGDTVTIKIKRDGKNMKKKVVLKAIPGTKGKVGLGITFADNTSIKTDPEVKIQAEDIGGPSAGLMFTLEIIDQLTKGDLTKGYNIAGTGEMLATGEVGRIGGIEKKVIAADDAGVEIFFAPNDTLPEVVKKKYPDILPNYQEALKQAKKIGTKMKIVPVKNVNDALDYLEKLPEKK
ncbi:SepM family pheromone-processing serine protease [Rummeliibacillus stabekisii]|uniref:endopeptidase La n=1 Tax=Rummeliibacillus stabekisii TaxID=241244 RepID=A0A143H9X3_9BACL|nr:SepM family pheromone-processing serine protease [Rummeliibacillus stabekisii]AMW98326.1 peptidase [Rummeliibacillus stabekisii]